LIEQSTVEITREDQLYRRLVPNGHVAPDGKTILLAAFLRKLPGEKKSHPDPTLSVDLARLTTPEATLARAPRPGFGVAKFPARVAMDLGLTVRHAPERDNYAHAQVEGLATLEQCQRLADASTLVLPPQPQPRSNF
jgi:hypothetical protein